MYSVLISTNFIVYFITKEKLKKLQRLSQFTNMHAHINQISLYCSLKKKKKKQISKKRAGGRLTDIFNMLHQHIWQ